MSQLSEMSIKIHITIIDEVLYIKYLVVALIYVNTSIKLSKTQVRNSKVLRAQRNTVLWKRKPTVNDIPSPERHNHNNTHSSALLTVCLCYLICYTITIYLYKTC